MVPLLAFHPDQDKAAEESCQEGNTQVDEDALRNLPNGNGFNILVDGNAKPTRHNRNKNIGIDRKKEDLKNGVKGNEAGRILCVSFGQVVPDNDHCDAAGKANQDDSVHIGEIGIVLSRK